MSRWEQRVDELLYDGESMQTTLSVATATVVVTSHRVLAFTPEWRGANFQEVSRPNVLGVGRGQAGGRSFLRRALVFGGFGIVLVAGGILFDPDTLLGPETDPETEGASQFSADGTLDAVDALLTVVRMLDAFLLVVGLGAILGGLGCGLYYWTRQRRPSLVIRTAGDADAIHLPRPRDLEGTRERLERSVQAGPSPDSGDVRASQQPDPSGDRSARFGDPPASEPAPRSGGEGAESAQPPESGVSGWDDERSADRSESEDWRH